MIFERFRRTDIPDAFESLSAYADYLKLLVGTNCSDNAREIWWDIRLHLPSSRILAANPQLRADETGLRNGYKILVLCSVTMLERDCNFA